jgi:hypothetical protein
MSTYQKVDMNDHPANVVVTSGQHDDPQSLLVFYTRNTAKNKFLITHV